MVPIVFALFGSVLQRRRRQRKDEENKGRTLVRRNSEVKLTDGMAIFERFPGSYGPDTV